MKKVVSLGALAVCVLVWAALQASAQYPSVGEFKNSCSVQPAAAPGQWSPARTGQLLQPADALKTGADSFAELRMDENNVYRLKSSAEVVVDKVAERAAGADGKVVRVVNVKLNNGELLAKLDKIPSGTVYTVQSPVATAGAVGTQFAVGYDAQSSQASVSVIQSAVEFSAAENADKKVSVRPYQRSVVSPWNAAVLRASGSGILSKAVLGKDFVAKKTAENYIRVVEQAALDTAFAPDVAAGIARAKARAAACRLLQTRVLDLKVSADGKTLGESLGADPAGFEKLFSRIEAEAQVSEKAEGPVFTYSMRMAVKTVEDAVGVKILDLKQGFESISLEEYGKQFGAAARLTTIRAAQVDAYRRLAERIYGAVVTSKTTVKDMTAENDQITSHVEGLVKGAEIADTKYFSDGSVTVTLAIDGRRVAEDLGKITNNALGTSYVASPEAMFLDEYLGLKEK